MPHMQTLTQRLANPTRFMELSARVSAVDFGGGRDPAGLRALSGVLRLARRLSAGRDRAHHVHSRAVRVALDDDLWDHRDIELRAPRLPASAGRCFGEGRGAARRGIHVSGAADGLAVGQADVGHLLGVGRAADVGADAFFPLSRIHRACARRSRTRERRRS